MSNLEKALAAYHATSGHNTRISKDVSWKYTRSKSLLDAGSVKRGSRARSSR